MTDRALLQQALEALQAVRITPASKDEIQRAWIVADLLKRRLAQPEQKRTWVGLTKEEAREISLANRPYVIDMVAALEAKLREKNT